MTLFEDELGDPRNAAFLAKAADLAYLPADEGKRAFKAVLGLDAQLFTFDNTQAYLGTNAEHVVVVFRGSEKPTSMDGLKDWLLTNAVNLLVVPEGRIGTDFAAAGVGAKFHQGFMGALAEIWDQLYPAVDAELKKQERPLWVAGHSLGGAIALLAAWRFQRAFLNVHQVYTFGAPMIGNAAATDAFTKAFPGKIYRYVNTCDLVPRLPTVSLVANDYSHCLKEMELADPARGSAVESMKALANTVADGILTASLQEKLWSLVNERIGAHDIANYASLVTASTGDAT